MKNVIAVGNLSYNINLFFNSYPIEGQSYSLVKKTKSLGNILNICIVLSKYGINTWYFSSIGDDIEGKEIINNLHSNLINADYVNIINNSKTNKNYIIRNLKNNSKTILYEKDNYKYELVRKLDFKPDVVYADSAQYELVKNLKDMYHNIKVITTIDSLNEENLEIAKLSDYIIIPLKYAQILTSSKINIANKKTIMDTFMKTKGLFSGKIIIYSEDIGSLYQSSNRLNIIPKLGNKNKQNDNSFDIYKSTIIYGIANEFSIDKVIKLATISKFLCDNNKTTLNIKEVIRIYEQNS